ncbi:sugar ABC transporter substrate-binding protein [Amycolatopsis antarctica]|uniref:Sugar ABC transporter substrate-binding protein n=1 Tax=Amycolatopsis antarctica TaxID=1854586 RepID=A0A263CYD3_9PSEU|nr:iron ABC transporter permease [Amycolatopsis antarctica]OZM71164.1 sugar ABC transporter substrate-binding protein [Amycolatopsis antarctica]
MHSSQAPAGTDRADAQASPAARHTPPGPVPAGGGSAVRTAAIVSGLSAVLVGSIVLAVGLGPATVPPGDTARYLWAALTGGTITPGELSSYQIVWQVRTPRVLLAAVVGAGLSAVGVAVQAMVRNALADPFILGISSGASVGAVAVGSTGALAALGIYAVSAGAFGGALLASVLVYVAARSRTGITPLRLVLTGVAMSFAFQAIMSVIIYLVPDSESTSTVLYWTMGSFGAATWGSLPVVVVTVLIGLVILHRHSRGLDVMSLGDETAASLGVDTVRLRKGLFVLTAVMTGTTVAVSGAIGFTGLVIPHLVRIVAGAGHARVLTFAPLAGAIFMVWVDLVSRTLVAPRELPLGVITALIGVPVFITLMRRRGYLFGGR